MLPIPAISCDHRNKYASLVNVVIRHLPEWCTLARAYTKRCSCLTTVLAVLCLQAHPSPPGSSLVLDVQHHTVSVGVRYVQQTAQCAVMRLMHAAQVGMAASDSHSCIGSVCPTYNRQVM